MTGPIGSGALDLTPAEAKTVSSLLTRYLCGTEVWAFGSRTNGNATPASDLDLVAFTNTEQNALLASVREAFDASDLRFRVDLLAWKEVPESFRKEISRHHVVVMARRQASRPGWASRKLGDFASLKYGKTLRGPDRVEAGTVPVFGSNGQVGTHDEALTAGPTVIVGRKGTVGAVHYSPEPCWPIDTTYWHEDADAELCRFKYYLLGALRLDEMNSDSAVPGLSRSVAHALTVAVPPPAQQRAVARFLGALDDRIALGTQIVRRLDGMARAIFKDWFVDFGPTRAKMDRRDAYLPPSIWALFPDRLNTVNGTVMPHGWSETEIGREVDVVGGATPSTKSACYWDGEFPWVTPKDLADLRWPSVLETRRRITRAGLDRISSGLLPRGTVLLSSRAPIGYVAMAGVPLAINQGFIGVGCRGRVSPLFMLYWLNFSVERLRLCANGSTFLELTKRVFRRITMVAPPAEVVAAFDATVRPMFMRMESGQREVGRLMAIRDRLIPRLCLGQGEREEGVA